MANKKPAFLYAVFNGNGNFVKAYVYHGWAERKANQIGGKIVAYVNDTNRRAIEIAEFITREEREYDE